MGKKQELVKNTVIITIGKICTQFLSFFLLPLYTAVLTTAEYGTVDLLMTYQQLIGYIIFFQIEQAIFRFLIEVRKQEKETSEIVSSCFGFAIIQAVFLAVVFVLIMLITGYMYSIYLYFYVIAVILSGLMLQIARGLGKNQIYALGSFISAISTIVLNIVFLVVFDFGVQGMLTSYILGNFLCAVAVFFILHIYRYLKITNFRLDILKKCLSYSIPLVPNALSWWIMSASDRTIVAYMLGTSFNGLLTVANKFSTAFTSFYTIFNLSWTESAALHIHDEDASIFFKGVIHRVYKLFSAAAIGIIAVMPFVFNVLVNKNYADAYYQIPIYMLASLCQAFQGMYSVIYVALKKTKDIAKTTTISALINIVVDFALIKIVGLYAASVSTLISYLFLCVWRYFDLQKYMDVRFNPKLLFSSIVVAIIVCITYYIQNIILSLAALAIAIIYAIILNKEILLIILKSPKNIKNFITHNH